MNWHLIDTASKIVETEILGYSPRLGIVKMRYDGWGGETGGFDALTDNGFGEYHWESCEPTHWMPLPNPPDIDPLCPISQEDLDRGDRLIGIKPTPPDTGF